MGCRVAAGSTFLAPLSASLVIVLGLDIIRSYGDGSGCSRIGVMFWWWTLQALRVVAKLSTTGLQIPVMFFLAQGFASTSAVSAGMSSAMSVASGFALAFFFVFCVLGKGQYSLIGLSAVRQACYNLNLHVF